MAECIDFNCLAKADKDSEGGGRFKFLALDSVIARPGKKYLVNGLIGDQDTTLLYGDAKIGKSLIVLDLMAALARGHNFFAGRFWIGEPVTVVYAYGEHKGGMPNRLRALEHKWRLTPEERARIIIVETVPQFFNQDADDGIRAFVSEFERGYGNALEGGLLIVDTFARASIGGEENDNDDMTMVSSAMIEAQEELKCGILANHHANKGGAMRGASAIKANVEAIIKVFAAEGGRRAVSIEAGNDVGETDGVSYRIENYEWLDEEGQVNKGGYVEWCDDPATARSATADPVADLVAILRNHARGFENCLPDGKIGERQEVHMDRKKRGQHLKALAENPDCCVQGKFLDKDDPLSKTNRGAHHYWYEGADE